jgi:hypothetical protein
MASSSASGEWHPYITEDPHENERDIVLFKPTLETKTSAASKIWYFIYPERSCGGRAYGNSETGMLFTPAPDSILLKIISPDGITITPIFYGQFEKNYISSFAIGSIPRPNIFYNPDSKVYKIDFLDKNGSSVTEVLIQTNSYGLYECTTSGCVSELEHYVEYDIFYIFVIFILILF